MSGAIFADDSTLNDKRDAAFERLYAVCPAPMRVIARPMIQQAVNNATEEQLASLLLDLDKVIAMAESGNVGGIAEIARNYGATDAQIAQYLPTA